MNTCDFKEILEAFSIDGRVAPFGSGHINDTYIVDDGTNRHTLQRINADVFRDPFGVMENIVAVTGHIREKLEKTGGDTERGVLNFLPASDGKYCYRTSDGRYFRAYVFIDGVVTLDEVEKPSDLYHAARAFGKFQKQLADFPAEKLRETIPDFHNTRKRFINLKRAMETNPRGRLKSVLPETEFCLAREGDTGIVLDAIAAGDVPVRVTHNDTKLNNVLIDKVSGEAICVIDLDTVMPGSLLYDYGDSLRFGSNTAAEDETDLSRVSCDTEYFEAFTKGYLEELSDCFSRREAELLAFSAKLLTLECGMRFLTDYLEGDRYFKIQREHHNLDRARTQFKLAEDMEKKAGLLHEIVTKNLTRSKRRQ